MNAHPPSCSKASPLVRVRVRVKAMALKSNHESTTKHAFHTPQTRQFNADLIHSIQSDQTQPSNGEETDSSSNAAQVLRFLVLWMPSNRVTLQAAANKQLGEQLGGKQLLRLLGVSSKLALLT